MADQTPGGTIPLPENPELANLKERETSLVTEIARLKKMNPGKAQAGGHDLSAVIQRTETNLVEVRKGIQEATK